MLLTNSLHEIPSELNCTAMEIALRDHDNHRNTNSTAFKILNC